jgi:hypothetical protein
MGIKVYKVIEGIILLMIISQQINGQTFRGVLMNRQDSLPIPLAIIKLTEPVQYIMTNERGEFEIKNPGIGVELHLQILYLNCHQSIVVPYRENEISKIFIHCKPVVLPDVDIQGYTAKEMVKKAIEAIPDNYFPNTYISPSFYRHYQIINGDFRNLAEAFILVAFNINNTKKGLQSKEAFAIESGRRSDFFNAGNAAERTLDDLLIQNPVLHPEMGALLPNGLDYYTFHFDSSSTDQICVINYRCDFFSTDNHSIENFLSAGLSNEGGETGKFWIERESLAFKKITRDSFRHPDFNYPRYNNFLVPDRKYTLEFIEGHTIVEYEKYDNKWFLKSIRRNYTNELFKSYIKEWVIEDYLEWYSNGFTRYVNNELLDSFYFDLIPSNHEFYYRPEDWKIKLPSWYFHDQNVIISKLGENKPVEQQFIENSIQKP